MEEEPSMAAAKIFAGLLGAYWGVSRRIVASPRQSRYVSAADWQQLIDLNKRMEEVQALLQTPEFVGEPYSFPK